MDVIELLQQMGLNKYEAEAYKALVAGGPMTGYELGKRSAVPLSRSYEVLERLSRKGLALVQPGNVPRYLAEDPRRLLAHFQSDFQSRMDALSALLISLAFPASASASHDIWVVTGRQNLLARVISMIEEAEREIFLALPQTHHAPLRQALESAEVRGCRVIQRPVVPDIAPKSALSTSVSPGVVLVVTDSRNALAGTISSPTDQSDYSQAVVTANEGLVAAVSKWFGRSGRLEDADLAGAYADPSPLEDRASPVDWLAWEERKQRRLLGLVGTGDRVA